MLSSGRYGLTPGPGGSGTKREAGEHKISFSNQTTERLEEVIWSKRLVPGDFLFTLRSALICLLSPSLLEK